MTASLHNVTNATPHSLYGTGNTIVGHVVKYSVINAVTIRLRYPKTTNVNTNAKIYLTSVSIIENG